ncbi:MAG: helix-turn-helix transcriptional regulator [Acidimicrobiales bacterium]
MSSLQVQARALGDPTRHEIFRYVTEADGPVGVAELTAHVGLNHNAVRQHLAKLVDAGLVTERVAPASGRGRPPLRYSPHPTASGRWGGAGPYERLAGWLAEIIATGETPIEVGRRAGRTIPRPSPDTGVGADPVAEMTEQMARQGFDPVVRRRGGTVELVLEACPYASTAGADPGTVCSLHLGLAQGIADGIDGIDVEGLTPTDPSRPRCRLRLSGPEEVGT